MKGNLSEPRSLILPVELRVRESLGPAPPARRPGRARAEAAGAAAQDSA